MSNNSFKINPITRDYEMDEKGKPVIDETLKTPAFFRLRIPRRRWLYAPNDDYGSDFYLIKKNLTSGNSSLTNISQKALEPLILEDRAFDTQTELAEKSRHGAGLEITIQESPSSEDETMFIPIGR